MMNSTTPSRSSRSRALPTLALGASLMLAPLGVAHAETTPATAESASAQPGDSNLSRGERPEQLQGRVHYPLGCYCRRRGSCDCRGRVPFVPSPLLRAA